MLHDPKPLQKGVCQVILLGMLEHVLPPLFGRTQEITVKHTRLLTTLLGVHTVLDGENIVQLVNR